MPDIEDAQQYCKEIIKNDIDLTRFDDVIAKEVIKLKEYVTKNNISEEEFSSKLRMLLFLYNELNILPNLDKLVEDKSIIDIAKNYPENASSITEAVKENAIKEILKIHFEGLGLDYANITAENRNQMLRLIYTENNEEKKDKGLMSYSDTSDYRPVSYYRQYTQYSQTIPDPQRPQNPQNLQTTEVLQHSQEPKEKKNASGLISDLDVLIKEFNVTRGNSPEEKERCIRDLVAKKTAEAEEYFRKNPNDNKMRREKTNDDCSVIRIKNGDEYETYLMATHGNDLGEGSFGRVKLAVRLSPKDDSLSLYVVKREWSNTELQQQEADTLSQFGLMQGEKMERTSTTTKREINKIQVVEPHKFYTVMPYLGKELYKELGSKSFSEDQKLDIAINVALEINKLHTEKQYAHGDLKLNNILLDANNAVRLIDFGFAKPINSPFLSGRISGTPGYLPGFLWTGNHFANTPMVNHYWQNLGNYEAVDVFALKRTINQDYLSKRRGLVNVGDFWQTNRVLANMLDTIDEDVAVRRKDTAAMLAANLILHRLNIYPLCTLSDEDSKKIVKLYEDKDLLNKHEVIAQELAKMYDPNIAEAGEILQRYLNVQPGRIEINREFAEEVIKAAQEKDKNVAKNKLQQLFFWRENMQHTIASDLLLFRENLFPPDYPHQNLDLVSYQNIERQIIKENLENLFFKNNALNIDISNIAPETYTMMADAIRTATDPLKIKVKLLFIYLDIKNLDFPIKTQDQYDQMIRAYQQASEAAPPGSSKETILEAQRQAVKGYMLYTHFAPKVGISNAYVDFANVDFSNICKCYDKYLVEYSANSNSPANTNALNAKMGKIVEIQLASLIFMREFIDADFLYNTLSENELAGLARDCNLLIRYGIPDTKHPDYQKSLTAQQKKLIEQIKYQVSSAQVIAELKTKYNLTIPATYITPERVKILQEAIKTNDNPDSAYKILLSFLKLDGALEMDDVDILKEAITQDYSMNMRMNYSEMRNYIAYRYISHSLGFMSVDDEERKACALVFDCYKDFPKANRPQFKEVLQAVKSVFDRYNNLPFNLNLAITQAVAATAKDPQAVVQSEARANVEFFANKAPTTSPSPGEAPDAKVTEPKGNTHN
ncbi:MAG: hypothetical protein A3F18_01300 [Legionellales bacterium RIFCSPHIGHO2_12_FULL_37_14]|nr:MAG: hypothetical protein A3F18_01300 [Legionellales bacterium RIFCSPHIGHO2_12_FULL_37_14]